MVSTVEEYLAPYPPEIRALAETLRGLVRAAVPEVREAVYPGWQLIGYRAVEGKQSRYFAFLVPFEDRVVLGFEQGVRMADPAGILTGSGRQVRQVELRPDLHLDEELVLEYLRRGAEAAWLGSQGAVVSSRKARS